MLRRVTFITAGVLLCAAGLVAQQDAVAQDPQKRTTKDGVFSAAQADTGKASFEKLCASCHAFAPWEKSSLSPDLAGSVFMDKWNTRPVLDLITVIFTSMPNDGSAFLDEQQSADLTAYILQQNGSPAGDATLKADAAAGQTTIVK